MVCLTRRDVMLGTLAASGAAMLPAWPARAVASDALVVVGSGFASVDALLGAARTAVPDGARRVLLGEGAAPPADGTPLVSPRALGLLSPAQLDALGRADPGLVIAAPAVPIGEADWLGEASWLGALARWLSRSGAPVLVAHAPNDEAMRRWAEVIGRTVTRPVALRLVSSRRQASSCSARGRTSPAPRPWAGR